MSILKTGDASTLDIVDGVKADAAAIAPGAAGRAQRRAARRPVDVRARRRSTAWSREAVIAAVLTALMILLFLGSWRSTLIIAVSIPLSILASIIVLAALGETINVMTLGGLALAVGILVDDATVDDREHQPQPGAGQGRRAGDPRRRQQIAVPAFVSTLCICIVFVPMFFLDGRRRATCSCRWPRPWCSRCWPRTCCRARWCRRWRSTCCRRTSRPMHGTRRAPPTPQSAGAVPARRSTRGFERLRDGYRGLLEAALRHRRPCSWPGSWPSSPLSFAAGAVGRPGLLPGGRRRPDQAARARAGRHAHRGDGRAVRRRRDGDPRGDPARRDRRPSSTTSACRISGINLVLHQRRHDRRAGRRHPGRAARGPRADRRLRRSSCATSCRASSRASRFSFLPGRHRQPDPELRPAGADRRAGARRATSRRTRRRAASC